MEIINATDGYKLGHHRMYPEGTQMVYSNWTPRSCRYFPEATEGSVVFGIQYFVKKYLIEEFNKWFALPKEEAIKQFAYRVGNFVDLNQVGTKHIEELYDLGYLPIEIKALMDQGVPKDKLNISVTHMVNPRGIENLSKNSIMSGSLILIRTGIIFQRT